MENLRITSRHLTDGSEVWAVKFEAVHNDATINTVTIECNGRPEAQGVYDSLLVNAAYAETDATLGDRKGPRRAS
jgi:hypothetical protein